jgi:putative glutamine amidotransferase
MSSRVPRPFIGVPASLIRLPDHSVPQHSSGERYLRAVRDGSGGDPFLIPALPDGLDIESLVDRMDGLFLTGGRANIEPQHYGGQPFPPDEHRDPPRDHTVLPLIRACVQKGVPVLGVCRGIQEMNVALGGTLHYRVHLVDGKFDHRMPREGDIEVKFGLRHVVSLVPGGELERLSGVSEFMVNSAHGQGIDRLAPGMVVEALSPDGLVEAVRLATAKTFTVGVQWHAEWRFDEHPISSALFRAFGEAARACAATRLRMREPQA